MKFHITCQMGSEKTCVATHENVFTKYSSGLNVISQTDSHLVMTLDTTEFDIFDDILRNSTSNPEIIINSYMKAREFFNEEFKYVEHLFKNMVAKTNMQVNMFWNEVCTRDDSILQIFKSREFPAIETEHENWENTKGDYPNIKKAVATSGPPVKELFKDYKSKPHMSNKEIIKTVNNLLKLGIAAKKVINWICKLAITWENHTILHESSIWTLLYKNLDLKKIHYVLSYNSHIEKYMMPRISSIYTLEQAHMFPPGNDLHPEQNAYLNTLTGDVDIYNSMPLYANINRMINPEDVFKRRLELISGGLVNAIDWDTLNIAISGSILIPCVAYSELEEKWADCIWDLPCEKGVNYDRIRGYYATRNHLNLTETDIKFLTFLEYYYPSYDSLPQDLRTDKVMLDNAVSMTQKGGSEYNLMSDIDISFSGEDDEEFVNTANYLLGKFANYAKQHNLGEIRMEKIDVPSGFKFKFVGSACMRPMEFFKSRQKASLHVGSYHLPCVRMWFDGRLFIYPECISALMGGANNEYTWFSCNKCPVDVILKYAQRGYSTILNKSEMEIVSKYALLSPRWRDILRAGMGEDTNIYTVIGINHVFLQPNSHDNCGIRKDLIKLKCIKCTKEEINLEIVQYSPCVEQPTFRHNNSKINIPKI